MDIKNYLINHGIKEHKPNIDIPLDFIEQHCKTDYFYNVKPITYDSFIIQLDCDVADKADFLTFDKIKAYFTDKGLYIRENAIYGTRYLHVMTRHDYDAMDLYNVWRNNSVNAISLLKHKYYKWTLNHPKQFNRHVKTIMDYFGDLYKRDKADLLIAPFYAMAAQDCSPNTDDYLPF